MCAAVALVATARVWADPLHRAIGRAEGEFRDHLWIAWLVSERVLRDHAVPLTFPAAGFPEGLRLYPLDPLNQAIVTALSPIVGLFPAIALLGTALLALTGIGAARLARACGAQRGGALAAAVLTMLGGPVLGPFVDGQTEGWGFGWGLLVLAEILDPAAWSRHRALRLGGFAAALMASAPYQAHGLLLVAIPAFLWRMRRGDAVRTTAIAALPVVVMAILLGAAMWSAEAGSGGQLTTRAAHAGDWPPRTQVRGIAIAPVPEGVSAVSPVAIGAYDRTPDRSPPSTGPRRYAGVVVPLLAVAAAVRDRRARPLVAGAILYAAIAAGSAQDYGTTTVLHGLRIPLPYDLFYRWFPLGKYAWKPAQYAVPAWGLACAAVALLPERVAIAGALAAGIELQAVGPTPLPLPAMEIRPLAVYSELATRDGGAVVEFPARARSRNGVDALPDDALLGQIFHRHPIGSAFGRRRNTVADGVLHALATTLSWPGRDRADLQSSWKRAADAGFGWLIVHGRMLTDAERDTLDRAIRPLAGDPTDYPDGARLWPMGAK